MFYYLFICRTKKLFEVPVESDFANEKAFNAAQYPPFFQIFLRIRFFNIELRFFGTAIIKSNSLQKLDVKDIYCLKQIFFLLFIFKSGYIIILSGYLFSKLYYRSKYYLYKK